MTHHWQTLRRWQLLPPVLRDDAAAVRAALALAAEELGIEATADWPTMALQIVGAIRGLRARARPAE